MPSPRKSQIRRGEEKDKAHAALSAESLELIAEKVTSLGGDPIMRAATIPQMLYNLANIFYSEAERVRTK